MKNLNIQRNVERSLSFLSASSNSSHSTIVDLCPISGSSSSLNDRILLTRDGLLTRVDGYGKLVWKAPLQEIVILSDEGENESVGEQQQQQQHSAGVGGWFSVTYIFPDLVCLSSDGAIVSVSPETGEAELVGEFENGIEAGVWSPDGEILALVTFAEADGDDDGADGEQQEDVVGPKKKSVLLSMNTQFEVLAEVDTESHLPSIQSSLSVGDDDDDDDDNNINKVSMCWRPDATLCAVSSVDASDSMRKIRIYKRETLELHAVGRTEDGSGKLVPNLQSTTISWAGPGCSQLLASVQLKGKKTNQVSFFEPNGLRHREFPLREDPDCEVLGLDWSANSDLLAVTIKDKNCDKVQLWHRSNYHWYLKKELRFVNRKVGRAKFHTDQPSTIYILFESGACWAEYDLRWDTSSVCSHYASSTSFVVDGCSLNTTPLDKAVVPPPLYAATLELKDPVSHIIFSHNHSSSILALTVLSEGSIVIIGHSSKKSEMIANYNQPTVLVVAEWGQSQGLDPVSFRDFVLVGEDNNTLYMVAVAPASTEGSFESLVEISLTLGGGSNAKAEATVTKIIPIEGPILRMVPWLDSTDGALIELEDGQLLEYEGRNTGNVIPSEADPLLEPCPWIAAFKDLSSLVDHQDNHHHRSRLVVGLSSRSRLYCHDLLLSDSASSFVLSPWQKYLCFTTSGSSCQLRFVSLQELHDFDPLMGTEGNFVLQGYEPRNVERGATLVSVLPNKPTAVLQLPRGNLEAIYPRALVLRHVVLKINEGDFKGAFEMMRCQKVDLNLMVDLEPTEFLKEGGYAETLVEQVTKIDYLNLFISSLQKVDSTQARFYIPPWWLAKTQKEESEKVSFDHEEKVNRTCQVLRSIMIKAEKNGKTEGGREIKEGHFLLPILSTFAKEEPPKLDDALSLIKENALAKHSLSSKKPPLFAESAQSSIHYLAFLADYELLFKTALGMYDYDIARAVARNSQMDPKKYLPLLKRYRELPTYYARFEVDMRLKRYESALRNLFESGSHDESFDNLLLDDGGFNDVGGAGNGFDRCLILINEHNLHQLGLELFTGGEQISQIMLSLGNHLLEERHSRAALTVFLASTPPYLERAKDAARMCRDWGAFFTVLSIETTGTADSSIEKGEDLLQRRRELARDIASGLVADTVGHFQRRKMLADAARVLLDYADDPTGAVDVLIQAEMWSEAQRIGFLNNREDLGEETLDSAVAYANSSMQFLEESRDAFCTANARYAEVLELRKDSIMKGESPMPGTSAEQADDSGSLFSAASNVSHLSMASNASTGTAVSSVISVRSTTSFSLSGADERNRHKSKFNQIGGGGNQQKGQQQRRTNRKTKRKKGTSTGRPKSQPGSQKELDDIVQTLRTNCVDDNYRDEIADTITFLARNNNEINLARHLYDTYTEANNAVSKSQIERIGTTKQKLLEEERKSRREDIVIDGGQHQHTITLEVEKEVDSMTWSNLPDDLHKLFTFLPKSFGELK